MRHPAVITLAFLAACTSHLPGLETVIPEVGESLSGADLSAMNDAASTKIGAGQDVVIGATDAGPTASTFTDLQTLLTDRDSGLVTNVCAAAHADAALLCQVLTTQLKTAVAPGGAIDDLLTPVVAESMPPGLVGTATIDARVQSLVFSSDASDHLRAELTLGDFDANATFDIATLTGMGVLGVLGNANIDIDLAQSTLTVALDATIGSHLYPYPWPRICGAVIDDASAWSSEAPEPWTVDYVVDTATVELFVEGTVDEVTVSGLTVFANGAAGNALESKLQDRADVLHDSPLRLFSDELRADFTVSETSGQTIQNRIADVGISGGLVTYGFEFDVDGDRNLDGSSSPDGHQLGVDNCPWTPNPLQSDIDFDGVGDACEVEFFSPEEIKRIWMSLMWKHCALVQQTGMRIHNFDPPEFSPIELADLIDPAEFIDWARFTYGLEPWVTLPPMAPEDAISRVQQRLLSIQPYTGIDPAQVPVDVVVIDDQVWLQMDITAAQDLHPDQLVLLVAALPGIPLY